jgi:hypothetical protein
MWGWKDLMAGIPVCYGHAQEELLDQLDALKWKSFTKLVAEII